MSWPEIEAALDGMLARRWYTNHGPMAQRFEQVIAESMQIRHAVAVTNPTIGLVMAAEALDLSGEVVLSALAPMRCVHALTWAGLKAEFRDVDPQWTGAAGLPGPDAAAILVSSRGEAALADEAWDRGLAVLSDGIVLPGVPSVIRLHAFGERAGAGCVLTDDDGLAARLRNIRSSYGSGPAVPVRRTANGRLSEAQAALGLLAWPPAVSDVAAVRMRFPDCRVIEFGDGIGLVPDTTQERDRMLAAMPDATRWQASSPPGLCVTAERWAERMVLLPHPGAA